MPERSPPRRRSHYVPLTADMIVELRSHAERTGVGSAMLLKAAKDKPRGLQASTVNHWLAGSIQSVDPASFAYVVSRWAALPTDRRMLLTPEMNATLRSEMVRTGIGPSRVLRGAVDRPSDLTYLIVNALATQKAKTVSVEHWEYLLARLVGMADVSLSRTSHYVQRHIRQDIAPADFTELRAHRERTGFGGAVLLRDATDMPNGLTPSMISGWLSGRTTSADPAHVAYVLARYRARP